MIDPQPLMDKYISGWSYTLIEGEDHYAETFNDKKLIEFCPAVCEELCEVGQSYVVLHEVAHAVTDQGHTEDFYRVLEGLVMAEAVPAEIAWTVEEIFPSGYLGAS